MTVANATWGQVYFQMTEDQQREVCRWAGWPYERTFKVPISDLEVRVIRILHGLGWHGVSQGCDSVPSAREYAYQCPVPGTRLAIDFAFADRLLEAHGCHYHACEVCGDSSWPGIREADAERARRIFSITGMWHEVVWNHETTEEMTAHIRRFLELEVR